MRERAGERENGPNFLFDGSSWGEREIVSVLHAKRKSGMSGIDYKPLARFVRASEKPR